MGIKVKIIEKSKPGHPEEKYYCAVPNENGMTKYFLLRSLSRNRDKAAFLTVKLVSRGILVL